MDRLQKYKNQVQAATFIAMLLCCVLAVGAFLLAQHLVGDDLTVAVAAGAGAVILLAWLLSAALAALVVQPLTFIWQAILHVAPEHSATLAPNLDKSRIAPELVTNLVLQVYQLASKPTPAQKGTENQLQSMADNIAHNLPLPLLAINQDQTISFANEAALEYLDLAATDVLHKNVYSVLDLQFSDEDTFDGWLHDCRANRATDKHAWQHVRLKLDDDHQTVRQFDLAAAYSKENPAGTEVLLTMFDQSSRYGGDDEALDFIALTVHELRTPLTALRGYIEVFEDELGDQLDPEMTDFMHKMKASAQQLTAFVGNILKVARIQEGQLSFQLSQEEWGSIVDTAIESLNLTAKLKGVALTSQIDPNLPKVGVDKISISEVLNNLLDNAIKYSGTSKTITVKATLNTVGLVETTVHDDGVGIPASVLPTLFQKFHRNHRNSAKIGGTGLGLYLCSALVKAHGGNIWLKSKEGQGTTVGFTIQPYSQLAGKLKDSDNKDIVRNAHGWIKNHSLYRR